MNKAYWNGHQLRGPITMEKPQCWTIPIWEACPDCKKYCDHIRSLPVLQSSGFEGMPVGEVEYREDANGRAIPVKQQPLNLSPSDASVELNVSSAAGADSVAPPDLQSIVDKVRGMIDVNSRWYVGYNIACERFEKELKKLQQ